MFLPEQLSFSHLQLKIDLNRFPQQVLEHHHFVSTSKSRVVCPDLQDLQDISVASYPVDPV